MSVKVRVQNFQSLKDASLEISGFTVVTGPNNSGKTALVRAIRGAVQNARGKSFIRHGEEKSVVELDFGDGHTLLWEKGHKTRPLYRVDGGDPIHPGQGVPDEVRALGIQAIKAGGEEIWPQIASQFHQVFLVDKPGAVLAEAIADLTRVTQLNDALSAAKRDLSSANTALEVRLADAESRALELSKFEGLKDIEDMIPDLERRYRDNQDLARVHQSVEVLRVRFRNAESAVARFGGVERISLPPDDSFARANKILSAAGVLTRLRDSLRKARGEEMRWEPLAGLSAPSISNYREDLANLVDLRRLAAMWRASQSGVNRWGVVDNVVLPDAHVLREDLDQLTGVRALSQRLAAARARVAKYGALDVSMPGDTAVTEAWRELGAVSEIKQRLQRIAELERDLGAQAVEEQAALSGLETQVSDMLAEIGECPWCASVITKEAHAC